MHLKENKILERLILYLECFASDILKCNILVSEMPILETNKVDLTHC